MILTRSPHVCLPASKTPAPAQAREIRSTRSALISQAKWRSDGTVGVQIFSRFSRSCGCLAQISANKTSISGRSPIQEPRQMLRNCFRPSPLFSRSRRARQPAKIPRDTHVPRLVRSIPLIRTARGWLINAALSTMNPKEARRQFHARNNASNDGAVSPDNRTGSRRVSKRNSSCCASLKTRTGMGRITNNGKREPGNG